MSVLIYSPQPSTRLEYILHFAFNEVLLCDYELTDNIDKFQNSSKAKINYSRQTIGNALQIIPHGLLTENSTQTQNIDLFQWNEHKAFFKTSNNTIPFDLFAASFYLISRYEEYTSDEKDEFSRFPHRESLAFKNNFLNTPLIDQWMLALKQAMSANNSHIEWGSKKFSFIPTYDIDIAYSYKHKGLLRNIGGALRDLGKGELSAIKTRIQVLLNIKKDPFDSFSFLNDLHKEYELNPIYFLLLGSGGKLDKNLATNNSHFQKLIKQIAKQYSVGIHPSYRSNNEPKELDLEIDRLNTIGDIQTTKSRQHYIRFELPFTYRELIRREIKEDYSMGYGSINGFRASTATPFYWFDLQHNEMSDLKIFPFCYMECNSFFEQKQNIDETRSEIESYIKEVKKVNGHFISVWHNFSLGTDKLWEGWNQLYEEQIKIIHSLD